MKAKNIRRILIVFILIQIALIFFALLIESSFRIIEEIFNLTNCQKILFLSIGLGTIIAVLYFAYRELMLLLSTAGITEQIMPEKEVENFKRLLRKVGRGTKLKPAENEQLERYTKRSALPSDFVEVYTKRSWSFIETFKLFVSLVLGVLAIILFAISLKKKDSTKKQKPDEADDENEPIEN